MILIFDPLQRFKYILLTLAFGVILMHSIVPHHHSEAQAQCIQEEQHEYYSLLSVLVEAFHLDHGDDNHLENFSGTSFTFFREPASASQSLVFKKLLVSNNNSYQEYRNSIALHPPFLQCETNRGHPTAV